MIIEIPTAVRNGVVVIPDTAVPADLDQLILRIDRTQWTNQLIDIKLERSLDGGAVWGPMGGGMAVGGALVDRDGVSVVWHELRAPFAKGRSRTDRRVRGTLTLSAPLRTQITLEIK